MDEIEFLTPEERAKTRAVWNSDTWKRVSIEPKPHEHCKKVLIIDATNYPLVKVTKPLSPVGFLHDEPLYGDEEVLYYLEYYDYQPEDLEGGKDQWLKDQRERALCLRALSATSM